MKRRAFLGVIAGVPLYGQIIGIRRRSSGGGIPILLSHTGAASPDGVNVTSPAISTVGSSLLVMTVAAAYAIVPSDSQGNTWSALTAHNSSGGSAQVQIYYCASPSTSASHTFTVDSTTGNAYPSICVAAFNHTTPSPFDQQNQADAGGYTTSCSTGSITPLFNGELIVAGLETHGEISGQGITNSMTITDTNPGVASQSLGSAMAYVVQTTAAAINPTWSWASTADPAAAIASFRSH